MSDSNMEIFCQLPRGGEMGRKFHYELKQLSKELAGW